MSSSLSDILSTIQSGVIALNNLAAQVTGSFRAINAKFMTIISPFFTGSMSGTSSNAGIELGSTSAVNTPFVDFHSSGNNIDYDSRIIASGGTGVLGTGLISIQGDLAWTGSAWTAWTPTVTSTTGVLTTASGSGRYKADGKTVYFALLVTITTNGTGATSLRFTPPVTGSGTAHSFVGREVSITGFGVIGYLISSSQFGFVYYDGTYPGANGANFYISGVYEAA